MLNCGYEPLSIFFPDNLWDLPISNVGKHCFGSVQFSREVGPEEAQWCRLGKPAFWAGLPKGRA